MRVERSIVRSASGKYEVSIYRRALRPEKAFYLGSFPTLAEAQAARDKFEAAHPKGKPAPRRLRVLPPPPIDPPKEEEPVATAPAPPNGILIVGHGTYAL